MSSRWDRRSWRLLAWTWRVLDPYNDVLAGRRGRWRRLLAAIPLVAGTASLLALVGWGVLHPSGKLSDRPPPSDTAETVAIVIGAVIGVTLGLVAVALAPRSASSSKPND